MNEETHKVLKRLERMAEKESLPSIGPVKGKIEVIEGDALEIIPTLNEKFDMAFLDGTKEEYLKYLKLFEKNLNKGAVIVADNVGLFETSMRDYLEYVRNSGLYNSKVLETELEFDSNTKDAIEVSIKTV